MTELTPKQHRLEALKLLGRAVDGIGDLRGMANDIAAAQVHALLAFTAPNPTRRASGHVHPLPEVCPMSTEFRDTLAAAIGGCMIIRQSMSQVADQLIASGIVADPTVVESQVRHARSVGTANATRNFQDSLPVAMRQVQEAAWDQGYTSGHSNAMRRMSDEPNAPTTVNPYAKKGDDDGHN